MTYLNVAHKIIDWICEKYNEEACSICDIAVYKEEVPTDVDPCPFRRKHGKVACRAGVISHFKKGDEEDEFYPE